MRSTSAPTSGRCGCCCGRALNALFLAADVFNAYVTLELLGLSAVALVALAATPAAFAGAMRYLLVGLLGSLLYLLGVGLLYAAAATLDVRQLAAAPLPGRGRRRRHRRDHGRSGAQDGSVPLPLLAAAGSRQRACAGERGAVRAGGQGVVLSAVRYWFYVAPELAVAAISRRCLGVLGAAAVVWGGLRALTAERLKLVVAYSTVAQIGYLFLVFPSAGQPAGFTAWGGVALLVARPRRREGSDVSQRRRDPQGRGARPRGRDRRDCAGAAGHDLFAFALAGVSLIGLPPSGGFAAKWMLLNAALATGQWWWVLVLVAGSLLAAAYTFRVLARAFTRLPGSRPPCAVPARLEWSALALALAAMLLGFVAAEAWSSEIGAPVRGPVLLERAVDDVRQLAARTDPAEFLVPGLVIFFLAEDRHTPAYRAQPGGRAPEARAGRLRSGGSSTTTPTRAA